jgi:hypothetical protein
MKDRLFVILWNLIKKNLKRNKGLVAAKWEVSRYIVRKICPDGCK